MGKQRFDSSCGKTGRVRAAGAFVGEREKLNRRISEGGTSWGKWASGAEAAPQRSDLQRVTTAHPDGQGIWPSG
jgi:hypothetical protein